MSLDPEEQSAVMDVVCAVLRNRQGKVLVCQRPEGKMLAGSWEFPGGKVEEGESFEAALHREIEEELGCGVRVSGALPAVLHAYTSLTIRLRPFLCSLSRGEPVALEHAAIRWVLPEKLGAVELAGADREIAQHVVQSA